MQLLGISSSTSLMILGITASITATRTATAAFLEPNHNNHHQRIRRSASSLPPSSLLRQNSQFFFSRALQNGKPTSAQLSNVPLFGEKGRKTGSLKLSLYVDDDSPSSPNTHPNKSGSSPKPPMSKPPVLGESMLKGDDVLEDANAVETEARSNKITGPFLSEPKKENQGEEEIEDVIYVNGKKYVLSEDEENSNEGEEESEKEKYEYECSYNFTPGDEEMNYNYDNEIEFEEEAEAVPSLEEKEEDGYLSTMEYQTEEAAPEIEEETLSSMVVNGNTEMNVNGSLETENTPSFEYVPTKTNEVANSAHKAALVSFVDEEKLKTASKEFADTYVKPIFSQEIEKGVPYDVIKGAAVSGAGLSILAGQGVLLAGAAGLGAAYVAVTPGPTGGSLRALGGVAWNSTQVAINLSKKYEVTKVIGTAVRVLFSRITNLIRRDKKSDISDSLDAFEAQMILDGDLKERISKSTIKLDSDVAKVVREAESAVADVQNLVNIQKEEEAKIEKEAQLLAKEQATEKSRLAAEEEARLAKKEEARLAAEEEARLAKEEEVRLAAEEEARLAKEEEARLAAEDEARLAKEEEARLAAEEEARLVKEEEAKKVANEDEKEDFDDFFNEILKEEEARLNEKESPSTTPDNDFVIDEDDWEASILLADVRNENEDGWSAARELAKNLAEESPEKEQNNEKVVAIDDIAEMNGLSMEELGRAARAAVEQADQERETFKKEANKEKQKRNFMNIPEAKIDIEKMIDARDAIAAYEKLTVVKLKDILRSRGLKVSGKKSELIERLRDDDDDNDES